MEQDFTYSTASEEMLEKLKGIVEEEGFYETSKEEYEALLAKVIPSKERDLEKFKNSNIPVLILVIDVKRNQYFFNWAKNLLCLKRKIL